MFGPLRDPTQGPCDKLGRWDSRMVPDEGLTDAAVRPKLAAKEGVPNHDHLQTFPR